LTKGLKWNTTDLPSREGKRVGDEERRKKKEGKGCQTPNNRIDSPLNSRNLTGSEGETRTGRGKKKEGEKKKKAAKKKGRKQLRGRRK